MARRLALLTLLACAAYLRRPLSHAAEISSESESLETPFSVWEEFEDSYESTPTPTPAPAPQNATLSAKVVLKGHDPQVNVTVTRPKEEKKKIIRTTNINIHSHTNFIVTKPPFMHSNSEVGLPINELGLPINQIGQPFLVMNSQPVNQEQLVKNVTKVTTRKPSPSTTRRPPNGRRTSSTRRPATSTRRPTTRPMRRTKTTKPPSKKKTVCPPKSASGSSGWLTSFFEDNKVKRVPPKKPAEDDSGVMGIFSTLYSWFRIPKSSWSFFDSSWFMDDDDEPKQPERTTTPIPLTSEDSDGAYITETNNKKPQKKALKKEYKGYQLIRTYADAQWKVHEMLELQEEAQGSGVTWWTPPSMNGTTDLLVPPDLLQDVKDHLKSHSIDFDVVIWDLQKAITYENPRLSKKQRLELEQIRGHPMTWRRYHRYSDILRYLEYLQHSYPELVELIPLGRSSEGLPLVAVKVSMSVNDMPSNKVNKNKKWKLRSRMKPTVWVDGGAHAREWIAPAVATWMIHALVEGEQGLGTEYDMLRQADFIILPVMNPDGYEHSHTHDRLWRKTRSRAEENTNDYYTGWFPWNWGQTECIGVDADRNWDYHWGEKDSSSDPCSDNYAGPNPFSEPETRAVADFLTSNKGRIKLYLSLHAYSQSWLVPSSHAREEFSDDAILMEMGKMATVALADLYGTKYKVGTAAEIRQPASGMSHDWAKARAGIKFSYHIDLRDSFGPYGFLLPGSQIVSTARETWQAVKAIVDNLNPGI